MAAPLNDLMRNAMMGREMKIAGMRPPLEALGGAASGALGGPSGSAMTAPSRGERPSRGPSPDAGLKPEAGDMKSLADLVGGSRAPGMPGAEGDPLGMNVGAGPVGGPSARPRPMRPPPAAHQMPPMADEALPGRSPLEGAEGSPVAAQLPALGASGAGLIGKDLGGAMAASKPGVPMPPPVASTLPATPAPPTAGVLPAGPMGDPNQMRDALMSRLLMRQGQRR